MRATTDSADSLIPAMSLDSPSDNAMTALYRVALGPVNTDHYLPIFARFDTTGRATTSWNWAASLCTLNWMVFRQVWSGALAYVAVAEGLALLVFALGRQFLNWPQGVELGVLAAFALLAFAVPGLYGNAILHADIRRRISRALAASRTVPEACALLEQKASTRKRLQAVVGANVALAALALAAYVTLPHAGFEAGNDHSAMTPSVTVAQAASAAAAAASAQAVAASGATEASTPAEKTQPPVAQALPRAQTPPAESAAPTVRAAPPEPAPASAPAPATANKPQPAQPPQQPSTPAAKAAPAADKPAPGKASAPAAARGDKAQAGAAAKADAAASKPTASASKADTAAAKAAAAKAPASKPAAATERTARSTPAASTKAAPSSAAAASAAAAAAPPASDSASAPLATVGSTAGYYINVGLFADEANARKAQARLLNEGLPAFRQELNNTKGRRIRVRVGPYDNRAQAAAAAESIRAMGLEAVVFKQ